MCLRYAKEMALLRHGLEPHAQRVLWQSQPHVAPRICDQLEINAALCFLLCFVLCTFVHSFCSRWSLSIAAGVLFELIALPPPGGTLPPWLFDTFSRQRIQLGSQSLQQPHKPGGINAQASCWLTFANQNDCQHMHQLTRACFGRNASVASFIVPSGLANSLDNGTCSVNTTIRVVCCH